MKEIHELFDRLFLQKNDFLVYAGNDPHLLNINMLRNNRKIEVDSFFGAYLQAFKIMPRKLKAMEHWVYVKKMGGHLLMKDDGYKEVYGEWQQAIDKVIRHYNHIVSSDNDIAEELAAMEAEKAAKMAADYNFNHIVDTMKPVTGIQLPLEL